MFVIALNPPIRQGQTRYPFLVFQFERDDEIELDLNLEECVSFLAFSCRVIDFDN